MCFLFTCPKSRHWHHVVLPWSLESSVTRWDFTVMLSVDYGKCTQIRVTHSGVWDSLNLVPKYCSKILFPKHQQPLKTETTMKDHCTPLLLWVLGRASPDSGLGRQTAIPGSNLHKQTNKQTNRSWHWPRHTPGQRDPCRLRNQGRELLLLLPQLTVDPAMPAVTHRAPTTPLLQLLNTNAQTAE